MKKYRVYLVQETEIGDVEIKANNKKEALEKAYFKFHKYDRDAEGVRFEAEEIEVEDDCDTCCKCGENTCGNDTKDCSCWEEQ